MEDQHILLIDTRAPEGKQRHFSLRHLIVGVSRATHQKYVHIDPGFEALLMSGARAWAHKSMGNGGENPADCVEDDYDDVNDLALYFNDPDEVPAAELPVLLNARAPLLDDPGDADIDAFFGGEGLSYSTDVDSDGDVIM
jgi:hypothetical protein